MLKIPFPKFFTNNQPSQITTLEESLVQKDRYISEVLVGLDAQLIALQLELSNWETVFGGEQLSSKDIPNREQLVIDSRSLFNWSPEAASAVFHYTGITFGSMPTIKIRPAGATSLEQTESIPQDLFSATFRHDKNEVTFSLQRLQELSDSLLVEGELALVFFNNPHDKTVIVRPLEDTLQIKALISNPEDKAEIWFYKRSWIKPGGTKENTLYYLHWKLDPETQQTASAWLRSTFVQENSLNAEDVTIATDQAGEPALMEVLRINTIGKRGAPLLKQAIAWIRQNTRFVQNRATIVQNRATYTDHYEVQGGSLAVQHVQERLKSTLQTAGTIIQGETNPPPTAGSALVTNKAVKPTQRSLETGAADAKEDSRIFKAQVSSAVGIPIALLFMDGEASGNLNSIIELMKRSKHRWERYRLVWYSFLVSLAKFTAVHGGHTTPIIVDVDALPIIEEDLQAYTLAVLKGNTDGLIPSIEAARMFLTRLGANNIEDLLILVQEELDRKEEARLELQAQLKAGASDDDADPDGDDEGDEGDGPLTELTTLFEIVQTVVDDLSSEGLG